MMNVMTWRPPTPCRAQPPRPAPRRAPRPAGLDAALAERDTVILLVVGSGDEADRAERCCRGLARDPGFEAVRVVRVRDEGELSAPERACWLSGDRSLAILGPDRVVSLPLARADAVDLFVAVSALA